MAFKFDIAIDYMLPSLEFPPAIIGWNRLEGRPRTERFDRALRAEVRDALWFLTRQWQFGEFRGEDSGSPVDARTAVRVDPIQHYAVAGQGSVAYDPALPLETHVEREPVAFDMPLCAEVTRYFWRLIEGVSDLAATQASYLAAFPLTAEKIAGWASPDALCLMQLALPRTLDASTLLVEIASGQHDARVDGFAPSADRAVLKAAGQKLREWFATQYQQPRDAMDDAWKPAFLEYQFAVATDTTDRGQSVLVADQYNQGHLDWFAFDVDGHPGAHLERKDGSAAVPTLASVKPLSFIPTPVSFGGMPSHRYWEMESRQIEFANIDANTTDIAKLLLTEFALVYGNDWCVIPYELRTGTLSEVVGILMSDNFGEQSLVLPAGRGLDDQWQRWSMFTMNSSPSTGAADTRFFLPPAVGKQLEADPLDKVHFLRDEMANVAWAVEQTVPETTGRGASGYTVAAATQAATEPDAPPPLHPTTATVRYVLGTDVPYNWIPFIPVHVSGSSRSMRLQRARVSGANREARTRIVGAPQPSYFINEEEVPKAGKIVTRSYQRARWLGGATVTWIGRRVTTGRGEGSSGLAFDQYVVVPK